MIDMQARNLLNNFGQDLAQRGVDLEKVEKRIYRNGLQSNATSGRKRCARRDVA